MTDMTVTQPGWPETLVSFTKKALRPLIRDSQMLFPALRLVGGLNRKLFAVAQTGMIQCLTSSRSKSDKKLVPVAPSR
jgi:hypothetical protein